MNPSNDNNGISLPAPDTSPSDSTTQDSQVNQVGLDSVTQDNNQLITGQLNKEVKHDQSNNKPGLIDNIAAVSQNLSKHSDLIEKQWVDQTNTIIKQTAEEPFERNRRIADLRADYIKKQFNRSPTNI